MTGNCSKFLSLMILLVEKDETKLDGSIAQRGRGGCRMVKYEKYDDDFVMMMMWKKKGGGEGVNGPLQKCSDLSQFQG